MMSFVAKPRKLSTSLILWTCLISGTTASIYFYNWYRNIEVRFPIIHVLRNITHISIIFFISRIILLTCTLKQGASAIFHLSIILQLSPRCSYYNHVLGVLEIRLMKFRKYRWLTTANWSIIMGPCRYLSESHLGLYSLRRRLISIEIPIINLRRSSDRLMFIMGISISVRRCLRSE